MRQEDRALLKRSQYHLFLDRYCNPSFIEKLLIVLVLVAFFSLGLLLFAAVKGAIALSTLIPISVFLLVAFSLGSKR